MQSRSEVEPVGEQSPTILFAPPKSVDRSPNAWRDTGKSEVDPETTIHKLSELVDVIV